MRALRVFGSFVYMTAVIFFCLCISAGPLCTFTINNMIVGRAVSSRVLDEVYRVWPEVTYGQMEAIEKGITDSAALQRLTGDLLDAMAEEAVMEETAKSAEMAEASGRTGNEAAIFLTDKTVEVETGKDGHDESSMWVMEANLDDCTGEALGYAMEVLLEAGARDVWYTPAYMKKNRPAYVLHVLTTAEKREELEQLVFSCTTTIGVRRYPVERTILPREVKEIQTRYGAAKVKICKRGGVDTCYPEYESVRAICRETGKRFMEVFHGVMEDGSISLQ